MKKECDEKYERPLNQLDKENLFSKNKIRQIDKTVNTLMENFLDHISEHSNYIKSKTT